MPADPLLFLKTNSLAWLGGYLLLHVLGAHLVWWGRASSLRPLRAIFSPPIYGWLEEAARLTYRLLLPYLALLLGVVAPQDMGLVAGGWLLHGQPPVGDWLRSLAAAAGLTITGGILLAWGWRAWARVAAKSPVPENLALAAAPWGWSYTLRDAAYLQMSWAFCRAACIPWIGVYAGTFLGLGLVFLAGLADPASRTALGTPGKREAALHIASLALLTALVYLSTRNLALCLAAHWLLQMAVARTLPKACILRMPELSGR